MRGQLDFEKYGGALLLGLKKVVVKSHGSSKANTIAASIANAAAIYSNGLIGKVGPVAQKSHFGIFDAETGFGVCRRQNGKLT